MDDPEDDRLTPVYPVDPITSVKAPTSPYRRWTWFIRLLAGTAALASIIASGAA